MVVTTVLSLGVLPVVFEVFEDSGGSPMRVRLAASPWWALCNIVASVLGMLAAHALGRRPYASAWVLVATTLLLLAGATFTVWSALALSCPPLGAVACCFAALLAKRFVHQAPSVRR
ncbi:MAG: hypothetical protein Q8L48_35935 [Archangium sp.]|nr:hypothetical protein [Archangium sp.]